MVTDSVIAEPAACGGTVAVNVVLFTTLIPVRATEPIFAVRPVMKFVPETVTEPPPRAGPLDGVMAPAPRSSASPRWRTKRPPRRRLVVVFEPG